MVVYILNATALYLFEKKTGATLLSVIGNSLVDISE